MADDDPVKIEAFEKMPVLDYFIMLDKRITDLRKQAAKQSKK